MIPRTGREGRTAWLAGGLACLVLAGVGACGISERSAPERIVLVVVDTLRRDHLSCYGGRVATPHIDALAADGQRIPNAVASFHQTTMSMGALFTGRTPSIESGQPERPLPWRQRNWCGMARFAGSGDQQGPCLPATLPTLGERMQAAGYETLGVASNALLFGEAGFSRGFDQWREVGESRAKPTRAGRRERLRWAASRAGDRVNAAVADVLDQRRGDRFFLYVHYMDVHDYALRGTSYARGVEQVDAAVGGLLDGLRRRGLLEGAVVVLTSDHGERLEESYPVEPGLSHRGNPSFGAVLRVPLLVRPARFARSDAIVRSEDLHRLLLELAGGEGSPPSALAEDELLVTEMHWRTYRRGRWKSAWARRDGRRVLFDLVSDPEEQRDRSQAHPGVLADHEGRIAALSRELSTAREARSEALGPAERERLRVLGYLDDAEPAGIPSTRPSGP
jgi:arylsulfatase